MKEIEWKYLVVTTPEFLTRPVDERLDALQGYLVVGKRMEWRVRRSTWVIPADRRREWHTSLKFGNGLVRLEYETRIPGWLGALLLLFTRTPLQKRRHIADGWAVDEFRDQFLGTMLAEYEVATADTLPPPLPAGVFLIENVTGQRTFANKNLARMNRWERLQLRERVRDSIRAFILTIHERQRQERAV